MPMDKYAKQPDESGRRTPMQKLNMVDADTLLYQPLDKPRFVVDGLYPHGADPVLRLTEKSASWLMLKLCFMRVGGAAFLGDGDTGRRCAVPLSGGYLFPHTGQAFRLTDEADSRLHFAVRAAS